jgi:type IV pilus assembly protein PilB
VSAAPDAPAAPRPVRGLASTLVQRGWVRQDEVDSAQQEAERTGERLGQVLLRRGRLTDLQLTEAVAEGYGLAWSPLRDDEVDREAILAGTVPFELAERYHMLPLKGPAGTLRIGIADPVRVEGIDELRRRGHRVQAVLVPASRVALWLASLDQEPPERKVERILDRIAAAGIEAPEGPVVQLLHTIITQAARERASDLHLEPDRAAARVRFRIDGVLHQVYTLPRAVHAPLVNAIKMAAKIDISQRLTPQDGKIPYETLGRPIDIRVATYPGVWGESVTLRLLDKLTALRPLDELGYTGALRDHLLALLRLPYGIILLTGPTGSGKTTTLYACLQQLASTEVSVMTIEDPVEYELPLVKQAMVNEQAGFTFQSALRSILRCDPDIILVGEIRDRETAELACQAALTGHLVFSTLHTNTAPDAVARLRDLGVPSSIIASALRGVVSQRLVRLVCPACAADRAPEADERALFAAAGVAVARVRQGAGCERCKHTGYRGRAAIAEILPVSVDLQQRIAAGDTAVALAQHAGAPYEPMVRDGLRKVAQGLTTVREVLRVAEWRA